VFAAIPGAVQHDVFAARIEEKLVDQVLKGLLVIKCD